MKFLAAHRHYSSYAWMVVILLTSRITLSTCLVASPNPVVKPPPALQNRASVKLPSSAEAAAELPPRGGAGGGTATIPNEVFNLVKSIVGAGVLSLPAGKMDVRLIVNCPVCTNMKFKRIFSEISMMAVDLSLSDDQRIVVLFPESFNWPVCICKRASD